MKRYVFMLFIFMFIIVSCSTNKSVTQDHVLGQWQFNGSSDVEKYYKKYGNGMLSSMEISGEIMKVGHLFLDGSFVEFKDNGIASFESNDVEYEIQQNENDAQIKFIDNGVESIHPVVFKKNKLQIAYFVLEKVAVDTEIKSSNDINMSNYEFSFSDLGIIHLETQQKVLLGMTKNEVENILGQGAKEGLYHNYSGLKVFYVNDELVTIKIENEQVAKQFSLDRNINIGDSRDQVQKAYGAPTYKKYSWETHAFTVENNNVEYLDFDGFQSSDLFNTNTITFVYKDKKNKIESINIANYYYGYQYGE